MNDRKKVINGLEKLRKDLGYGLPDRSDVVMEYLNSLTDAIVLLKEQEPKLLTFDEVKKHFLVPKELLGSIGEYIDYVNDIEPLYLECRVEDAFVCHWRTHENISMHLDGWENDYNKTWRCWTKKPTQEQMKEMKWDVIDLEREKIIT